MRRICFILAATLTTALAQKAPPPPVTPEKVATMDPSITLIGIKAKVVAVCDRYNLAVVGADEGTLQVYSLQNDGTAASAPVQTVTLPPLPADFQSAVQAPLSVIFHPVLPLLYVWQDVTTPLTQPYKAGWETLPHLVIYKINGQNLELVGSYAKGESFAYGMVLGSLGISPNGLRLMMPNCYSFTVGSAVAYYDLTEAGLPVVPAGKTEPESTVLWSSNQLPMGMGMVTGPNGLVIAGTITSAIFMDTDINQRLRMYMFQNLYYMAGGNPTKPICYFSSWNYFTITSIELADGYMTQKPRVINFTGVQFKSPPVTMTAKNQLAVAGNLQLVLINLDENGWPLPKAQVMDLTGAPSQLAYSEKFKRLYVPAY